MWLMGLLLEMKMFLHLFDVDFSPVLMFPFKKHFFCLIYIITPNHPQTENCYHKLQHQTIFMQPLLMEM